jgi:uncharacterized protein
MRSLAEGAPGMEFTAPAAGKAGVEQYLEGIAANWEVLRFEVEEIITQGERAVVVVAQCTFRNRLTGKAVETPKVDLWRFEDGKAVEFRELYDTAGALAAARTAGPGPEEA